MKVIIKKSFKLTSSKKDDARQVDSVKHEIKKYLARERRKKLPEGADFWDFDCRFGETLESAVVINVVEINSKITNFASDKKESFYIEILAKSAKKEKK